MEAARHWEGRSGEYVLELRSFGMNVVLCLVADSGEKSLGEQGASSSFEPSLTSSRSWLPGHDLQPQDLGRGQEARSGAY